MVILVLMRYAGTYVSVNIDRDRYLWGIYGYSCAYASRYCVYNCYSKHRHAPPRGVYAGPYVSGDIAMDSDRLQDSSW